MTPIENISAMADNLKVREIANVVIDNPKFPLWAGASKSYQHHYGKGGLAQHTWEVIYLSQNNNNFFKLLNKEVCEKKLFLAALYHDVGKIWDYEPLDEEFKEWKGNEHRLQIHHLSRSALVWNETATKFKFPESDDVLHAILSHHGLKEWGSPVKPRTRLAWLLHLSDALSARIDDCYKVNQHYD